jgi:hypothetical protein
MRVKENRDHKGENHEHSRSGSPECFFSLERYSSGIYRCGAGGNEGGEK